MARVGESCKLLIGKEIVRYVGRLGVGMGSALVMGSYG